MRKKYHAAPMTAVPFGIKYPSYSSSSVAMCATPAMMKSQRSTLKKFLTKGKNQLPTHRFLNYCVYVRQIRAVVKVWKAIHSDDCIDFGLCLSQDFRIHRHGQKKRLSGWSRLIKSESRQKKVWRKYNEQYRLHLSSKWLTTSSQIQ